MKALLLLLIFGQLSFAADIKKVHDLLPAPVNQLKLHVTTLKEAEKLFGKADLVEGKNLYWEQNGLKYGLQLKFNEENLLKEIRFIFTKNQPPLEKLGELDKNKIIMKERFFQLKEEKFEVEIDPTTRTVRGVRLQ